MSPEELREHQERIRYVAVEATRMGLNAARLLASCGVTWPNDEKDTPTSNKDEP